MNAGIYRKPAPGVMEAVYEGLRALGWETKWRNPRVFSWDQVEKGFDLVVVLGFRIFSRTIVEAYNRIGIPALVVDLGWIHRPREASPEGYYQIGLNTLNWIPPTAKQDRLKALEVKRSDRELPEDGFVLFCGQNPDDAQHDMNIDSIRKWALETRSELKKHTRREIRWRPHPFKPAFEIEQFESCSNPREVPLEDELKGAHAVVTFNSTAAFEALLMNVPVFADDSAFYRSLVNTDLAAIEDPLFPVDKVLNQFLARLAYAQWNLEEIREGKPFEFMEPFIQGFRERWARKKKGRK
jgi:hypothetical protein